MELKYENWNLIKQAVRETYQLSGVAYMTWIEPLQCEIYSDELIILVPDNMTHAFKYIYEKYKGYFENIVCNLCGRDITISFKIEKSSVDMKKSAIRGLLEKHIITDSEYKSILKTLNIQ